MNKIVGFVTELDSISMDLKPVLFKNNSEKLSNVNWTNRFYELFLEIKRGNIKDDFEMARFLKIEIPSQTYVKVKNDFKNWLINTLYALKNEDTTLERSTLKYRAHQDEFICFNTRNTFGSPVVRKGYEFLNKKTKSNHFMELKSRTDLYLMSVCNIIEPGSPKVKEYGEKFIKYEELYQAEEELNDAYEDIFIKVRTASYGLGNIKEKLVEALALSDKLLGVYDTYELHSLTFKLRQLKMLDELDVENLKGLCLEAADYFKKQNVYNPSEIGAYQYQFALCLLQESKYDEAKSVLSKIINSKKMTRELWLSSNFLNFVLHFKSGTYKRAVEQLVKVLKKDVEDEITFADQIEWINYVNWIKVINLLGVYRVTNLKLNNIEIFEEEILRTNNLERSEHLSDLLMACVQKDFSKAALIMLALESRYKASFKHPNGKRHELFFNFIRGFIDNNGHVDKCQRELLLKKISKYAPNFLSEYFEYEVFPYEVIIEKL